MTKISKNIRLQRRLYDYNDIDDKIIRLQCL